MVVMNQPGERGWKPGLRLLVAVAAVGAVGAAACGAPAGGAPTGTAATTPPAALNVELDWVPNPDHVGLYYAQHQGYFTRQRLTVNFRVPSSAADPLKLVGLNKADLAISYEPELFYAQQEHLPVTAVAAVVPVPLNGLIVSPKLEITSLCQIRGHSVGFAGVPSDFAFYDTLLRTCHLSRQQVPYTTVGYKLAQSILSGKVDSIIGGYRNVEAIQISQEMEQRATDFPANQLGVPDYDELVLVANSARLKSDPHYAGVVRRFLAAFLAGTAAAMRNPAGATGVMRQASQYSQRFLQVSVPYTLKLLAQHPGLPTGCLELAAWQRFGNWLKAHDLIHQTPNAAAITTDKYLPYRSCRPFS
jgi:putative hydroxymethylpyrimidine transport system substrate-binding protein